MALNTIILAAGQGTRMRSSLPKVLHKIGGVTLLEHVVRLSRRFPDNKVSVVYGHGGDQVPNTLNNLDCRWIEQKQQLGTGHAVIQALPVLEDMETVLILYGDVPLLDFHTVELLLKGVSANSLGLLTVSLDNPAGYGRIMRDSSDRVIRIVEEKEATDQQREIKEVNTGIMAVRAASLKKWLTGLKNDNAQGEYYLTDIIELAVADGLNVVSAQPTDSDEVLGVNDKRQLAMIERVFQAKQAASLMAEGVTLLDPARFDLRGEIIEIGHDVIIDVNVIIEGQVRIGDRVRIGANVVLKDSKIADDVEILPNCVIEHANIGEHCQIGPFSRVRPESELADGVRVGNFVEIKKSSVASGSKVNHLSYIGDAQIGKNVNIGAGTITCNYDGANKSRTVIEDGAFIGSDTQLVAPVTVERNATIGAGSTITKDAPENKLTLSRSKQISLEGWQRPVKKRS